MTNPSSGRSGSFDPASLGVDPTRSEPRYRQIIA
jgi:hypothetical protein